MAEDNATGPGNEGSLLEPEVDVTAPATSGRTPDLRQVGETLGDSLVVRSVALSGLLILALFTTLYLARAFFLPVAFAILLDLLLSPVVRWLTRLRMPTSAAAALVILGGLSVVGVAGYALSAPAQEWMARAPADLATVRTRLQRILRPMEAVTKTAAEVEKTAQVAGGSGSDPGSVTVIGPSLTSRLFGTTQALVVHLLEVTVLLYFLLAAGDLYLQKLIKVLPLLKDKKKAVQIARETESSVSTYLFSVALINVSEGLVVGLVMYLLGMPAPALWGVLCMLLEFIPYVGAGTMVALLSVAAINTFDSVGRALLVPACFLAINLMQANLVTPLALGRQLRLNPVAVFVSVLFWWWLWGISGAFIAVPLMATFKIFCDHIESLAPVGEFLGR